MLHLVSFNTVLPNHLLYLTATTSLVVFSKYFWSLSYYEHCSLLFSMASYSLSVNKPLFMGQGNTVICDDG